MVCPKIGNCAMNQIVMIYKLEIHRYSPVKTQLKNLIYLALLIISYIKI